METSYLSSDSSIRSQARTIGTLMTIVPQLNISTSLGGQLAQVQIPEDKICNGKGYNPSGCWLHHLIFEVTDR